MIRTLNLASAAISLSSGTSAQALIDVDYCYEPSSLYWMFSRRGKGRLERRADLRLRSTLAIHAGEHARQWLSPTLWSHCCAKVGFI
jgi:hypothetical protein